MMKTSFFISGLFFLILAALLRWPTIPYIDSAPLDPNFPLHALAAKGISDGHILSLPFLEWPSGASMRYIAWPILLIAAPLNLFLSAIASMNIAVWLWMWIQGLGGYWIGIKLNKSISISLFLGTASMCSPCALIALGNGQYENITLFPLLWFICALYQKKSIFIPFMLCLFSSPYQGLSALMAIPFFFSSTTWKKHLVELGILLLCAYFYYAAVPQGTVHESVAPAAATLSEKAQPLGLFIPTNIAENGGVPLSGPLERIIHLTRLPTSSIYNHRWPWILSTASSYIGWVIWGLFLTRINTLPRSLLLWVGTCLILSFGQTLGSTQIPLPWMLLSELPSIGQMQATSRFLCGATGAMLFCIVFTPKKYLSFFIPLLILDGLLITPAHWPVQAKQPLPSTQIINISQPVAFWPAAPVIASHKVTMTALMLEQPLSLFAERHASMPNAEGKVSRSGPQVNREDQTPTQWKVSICTQDVREIIQFRDIVGNDAQPFIRGVDAMRSSCDDSFCRWSLCTHQKEIK